ncbi:hypothetical protein IAQ61_007059 [Plenodomus lingam]|uniref:uncharacterized protein n=1 Tax=Leptosphaeria maculans TaxID=5022 RepID=UPI0033349F15|nr:hypothetical protein IAQ61_007059 [Plenodomus lingam]
MDGHLITLIFRLGYLHLCSYYTEVTIDKRTVRSKSINLGHIGPGNLLKCLTIKTNKNTVGTLLVDED